MSSGRRPCSRGWRGDRRRGNVRTAGPDRRFRPRAASPGDDPRQRLDAGADRPPPWLRDPVTSVSRRRPCRGPRNVRRAPPRASRALGHPRDAQGRRVGARPRSRASARRRSTHRGRDGTDLDDGLRAGGDFTLSLAVRLEAPRTSSPAYRAARFFGVRLTSSLDETSFSGCNQREVSRVGYFGRTLRWNVSDRWPPW